MKRWYITLALAAVGFFCLSTSDLSAHGGTYKGPGDTVPPGGAPPAPATPATPATPSTPSTPGTPSTPTTPAAPAAPVTPTTPTTPGQAATTGAATPPPPDLSRWVFWWEFNKDRFLNLKAKVHGGATVTDGVGPIMGLGGGAKAANTQAPSQAQIQNIIVPALFDLIEKEDDRDIATAVMIALAKIGQRPEDARKVYEEHLNAPVQEVAETAALSYGILKDELSIPLLVDLLQDTPAAQSIIGGKVPLRNKAFAAYGLGMIGRGTTDESVKLEVADTLYQTLITDKDAAKDIRVACVISLGVLQLPEPTDMVMKLSEYLDADEDDALVLAHIPNAMAKMLAPVPAGDVVREQVIDQLIKILDNKPRRDVMIRQSSVQAVGMLATAGDKRNKDILKTLQNLSKKGKDQQLKHYTAISMAYIGVADATHREDVLKFLTSSMKKSSTQYEPWCGLALGVMAFMLNDAGQAIPAVTMEATLAKFRKTRSPERKAAYAVSLGLMRNELAKSDIREAMDKTKDSQFRGYAAIALGLLDAREAMTYIGEVVDESKRDPDLLKQASIGLGLMKDRSAVDRLIAYLSPEDGKRPRLAVLSAVATALGFIGDKNSVQPLVDTLANDRLTTLGRAFAAVSLGMVADKDQMPWNSIFGEDLNYRAAVFTLIDQSTGTGILDIL